MSEPSVLLTGTAGRSRFATIRALRHFSGSSVTSNRLFSVARQASHRWPADGPAARGSDWSIERQRRASLLGKRVHEASHTTAVGRPGLGGPDRPRPVGRRLIPENCPGHAPEVPIVRGVRFSVLGPLLVSNGAGPVDVEGRKERVIVAVLVASRGGAVSADQLVDALWGDHPPRSAHRTLAAYVSRVRRAIDTHDLAEPTAPQAPAPATSASLIKTIGSGWALEVEPDATDVGRFEERSRLAREALAWGRFVESASHGADALAEWRGAAFDGFSEVRPCALEASRLELLRLDVEDDTTDAQLGLGHSLELSTLLTSTLEGAVRAEPMRERRWAQLMLVHYRAGRQSAALTTYLRARETLVEQAGVEPGADLRRLHEDILDQSPSLRSGLWHLPSRELIALAPCPFKALEAYEEQDAGLLLGRERLVSRLVDRLSETRFLCLTGASGSGKSSVLRAGLVTAVRSGAIANSERWKVEILSPGAQPRRALAAAMAGAPDLLVIDQLEEAFTLCQDADERRAFLQCLASDSLPCRVVCAVRADYWADCTSDSSFGVLIGEHTIVVGPMSDDELRRVVTEGARRGGLRADPDLVEAVVADVDGHAGALPLVSTALARAWDHRVHDRLTCAGYRAAGGLHGAISGLAEEAFQSLDTGPQQAVQSLLLRLSAPGRDGRPVRRRAPMAELVPVAGGDRQVALDCLIAARLVMTGDEGVEVTHEALFDQWPRLARWLDDDAVGRRLRLRLHPAAVEWASAGRPDADLFRGPRLVETVEWAQAHAGSLIPVEEDFLDASVALASREKLLALAQSRRDRLVSRRLRLLLVATSLLLVAALAASVLALRSDYAAQAARNNAVAGQLGAEALLQPRQDLALLLAAQAVRLHDDPGTRSDLLAAVLRAPRALAIRDLGHRLESVAVSPDGTRLAVSDNQGAIWLVDARTLHIVRLLQSPTGLPVSGLVFASAGDTLVSADQFSTGAAADLVLRSSASGQVIRRFEVPDVGGTAINPAGTALTGVAVDANYFWRDTAAGWRQDSLGASEHPTNFSADGSTFAVVDNHGGTTLRSSATGAVLRRLPAANGDSVNALSPDGRVLATSEPDGTVRLFDTLTDAPLGQMVGHTALVETLAFSTSGRLLVSASDDGTAIVWDTVAERPVEQLRASQQSLTQASFSPDARTLYTTAQDGTLASWDVTGQRGFGSTLPIPRGAACVAVAPSGAFAAVGTEAGSLAILDGGTLRVRRIVSVGGPATAVAFDPTRSLVAVGTVGSGVAIVDATTGAVVRRMDPRASIGGVSWSPDGTRLALTDDTSRRVVVMDATGRVVSAHATAGLPAGVAWSRDASLLATGVAGSTVAVTDPATGRLLHTLPVSDDPVAPSVAFLGGTALAVGGRDGDVRLWDASLGAARSDPVAGTTGIASTLSTDNSGRLLAVSGYDGSLVLIDTQSRSPVGTALPGPQGFPVAAVIDSGRSRLLAVYANGTAAVWDLDPASWLRRACTVPGRRLTREEWASYLGDRPYAPAC